MQQIEDQLTKALEGAEGLLSTAELSLVEAKAEAELYRSQVKKLRAALAALSGEETTEVVIPIAEQAPAEPEPEAVDSHTSFGTIESKTFINPYDKLPCGGCGSVGMHESMKTISNRHIRVLICDGCRNEQIL